MIRVYDGSGNLRARIDNSQLENYGGAFNYHREFFATGSFASDTKIYAIQRVTSSREYKKFGKVMTVTGPTSSAYDVAFDQHDRAAVVSKDGYFYLWTVDVRYQLNEDPRLLNRVALEREMKHVALHPTENVGILEEPGRNYRQIAITANTTECVIFDCITGEKIADIAEVCAHQVKDIRTSPDGKYFAVLGMNEKQVCVYKYNS